MKIISNDKAKVIDNLNKRMIINNQRVINARQGVSEVCKELLEFLRVNEGRVLNIDRFYQLTGIIDDLVDKVDRPLKLVSRSIVNLNNNL